MAIDEGDLGAFDGALDWLRGVWALMKLVLGLITAAVALAAAAAATAAFAAALALAVLTMKLWHCIASGFADFAHPIVPAGCFCEVLGPDSAAE